MHLSKALLVYYGKSLILRASSESAQCGGAKIGQILKFELRVALGVSWHAKNAEMIYF